MSRQHTLESLVTVASDMRDTLSGLQRACAGLPMLAEREHIALVKQDMRVVNETQSAKMLVAEEMERHVLRLRQHAEKIVCMYREVTGDQTAGAACLTDSTRLIQRIRDVLSDGSTRAAVSVVDHLINGLGAQLTDFKKFQREVWPRIEANQTIIAKQLRFHREHFLFWKKIEEEMAAPYGRRGAPVATPTVSVLNVKA